MNANEISLKTKLHLNRIRLVARFFKWICVIGFGATILLAAIALIKPDGIFPAGSFYSGAAIKSDFSNQDIKPGWGWVSPFFWIVWTVFGLLEIWFFYRLFENLERGIIFGRKNTFYIRVIGCWMIAQSLGGIVFEFSKIIWAKSPNPNINIDGTLLSGIFILLVAWIMDEGRKIQEEQELTV